eukprot:scaffold290488_cov28-Attheya_sp.AAC.1
MDPLADDASFVFELREGLDPGRHALSASPIIDDREETVNFKQPPRALSPEDHLVTAGWRCSQDQTVCGSFAG